MAAQKFTRKELKTDPFVTQVEKSLNFLQANATAIGAALLVLVVLLVGGTYVRKGQEASRQEASYLLYLGQSLLSQGDYLLALSPLEECVEKHGRTDFAKYARASVVEALLGSGEVENALARLDVYRQEVGPKHPARQKLELLQAHALADAGRFADAADALGRLTDRSLPDVLYYERTVRRAAWLERAGQPLESVKLLTSLKNAIASGDIQVAGLDSDLEQRLQVVRALAR